MSQVNTKTVLLGSNADQTKNFKITVPTPEDGSLTIERGDGTDVLSLLASGLLQLNNGIKKEVIGGGISAMTGAITDGSWTGVRYSLGNVIITYIAVTISSAGTGVGLVANDVLVGNPTTYGVGRNHANGKQLQAFGTGTAGKVVLIIAAFYPVYVLGKADS